MFNIVTWNINGIRSSQQNLKDLFDSLGADVILVTFIIWKSLLKFFCLAFFADNMPTRDKDY
jgi:hypothetical protein